MADEKWDSAVVYQIYWKSFKDGNDDGIGDIVGLKTKIQYIKNLGVDAVWLNPTYPSPQGDHGYDVSDYFGVEPTFGTLAEFEEMVLEIQKSGLMVLLDIVPNHVSSQHKWFKSASNAGFQNPYESLFIIREGTGKGGLEPPNDWKSVFGGPAWSHFPTPRQKKQRWYLHMFDPCQPDLNWQNSDVKKSFERILRFWFNLGIDGFRIDVAHGLFKAPGLPNLDSFGDNWSACWDQPEVHDIYRKWRLICDEYETGKFLIGEIHTSSRKRLMQYLGDDQLDAAFDFSFLHQKWSASGFRDKILGNLTLWEETGRLPVWTLSNHDEPRHLTRYMPLLEDGTPDIESGELRYKSLLALISAMPGRIFLYNGEELGLPQATVPIENRQDPAFFRQPSDSDYLGRDGCRVPLPWDHKRDYAGFSNNPPWLPMPDYWPELSVSKQEVEPQSMLNFYKKILNQRKENSWMRSTKIVDLICQDNVLFFTKISDDLCVDACMNFGNSEKRLPLKEIVLRTSDRHSSNSLIAPGEIVFARNNAYKIGPVNE